MKDRIIQIMKSEGLSNADFAEKIGISTSSLSHIFSGRNNPSLDVVTRIHKAYPDINIMWLLYGEGEMKPSSPVSNDDTEIQPGSDTDFPAGYHSGVYPSGRDSGSSAGYGGFSGYNIENQANQASENREIPHNDIISFDFRTDGGSERPNSVRKDAVKEEVRYIEKPHPKITEIRIFFDNGTFEVFKPDASK